VERVAAALGLAADLARDPRELSAGRQQSVLLGASLTAGPRLLVADEPGAHLDAEARRRALALVGDEVRRGMAVVWVTQDPDERGCAHRDMVVGEDGPKGGGLEAAATAPGTDPPREEAPTHLVIEVSAPGPAAGPRVTTRSPMSIRVPARGVMALEGPNGSGKSVLLGAVAGVLESHQVTARWSVAPEHPPILAAQYPELEVFEEFVLDEVVWAAVQRGLPCDAARREAVDLLRRLGCPADLAGRRVWGLSGGEKRLVQLAGALLAPAGVVLLDEPTAGLDPGRREALAVEVRRRGLRAPVLTASQDGGWLDRVAGGRIRLAGRMRSARVPSQSKKTD
jgi:energy-coupling factor transporter ATP-binding protein EcfA2